MQSLSETPERIGSHDGSGAADNDIPYRFGRRPTVEATYPFSMRQFSRLLVLRGLVQDGLSGCDDRQAA